jgi:hypothetical protein
VLTVSAIYAVIAIGIYRMRGAADAAADAVSRETEGNGAVESDLKPVSGAHFAEVPVNAIVPNTRPSSPTTAPEIFVPPMPGLVAFRDGTRGGQSLDLVIAHVGGMNDRPSGIQPGIVEVVDARDECTDEGDASLGDGPSDQVDHVIYP